MELIHQFGGNIEGPDGRLFIVRVLGEAGSDGMWHGALEFVPLDGGKWLRTGVETSQRGRGALAQWAAGLEPVYREGALDRATEVKPRPVDPHAYGAPGRW
jgi:hypothetical protein